MSIFLSKYLKNTIFYNSSGLDNTTRGNLSTAYDMALLTRYAMNNEHYRRIVSTKDIIVKSSLKTYKWTNKNKLLLSYEYCTGGKTGFTKKAKRTLVTTASKNGMNLIIVTFNDGNDFNDHKKLYEKYFNNYEVMKVLNGGDKYGNNTYLNSDFNVIVNKKDKINTKIIMDNIDGKRNGEIVGKIEVILNDKNIGYRYLYLEKESVRDNKSIFSRLIYIVVGIASVFLTYALIRYKGRLTIKKNINQDQVLMNKQPLPDNYNSNTQLINDNNIYTNNNNVQNQNLQNNTNNMQNINNPNLNNNTNSYNQNNNHT